MYYPNSTIRRYFTEVLGITEDPNIECFDVAFTTNNPGIGWNFGNCLSTLEYSGIGTYSEKCCLPRGSHIMSCLSYKSSGWAGNFISFLGHRFCDDHVGYKAMRKIDAFGMFVQT